MLSSTDAPPSQFIDVHGVRTHLREQGSGEPLLYLHGAGGGGPWRRFYQLLAQDYRLIVPDHPGFGQSDQPEWLESMDDVVYHYLDLLETLGLSRVHLVGSSLGGWIATELAAAHPEVVDRLVLVAPAGLKRRGLDWPNLFALTPEQHAQILVHDRALAEQVMAEATTPEAIAERSHNYTTFARLSWNPYLHNPKLKRRLYRMRMPTLIIWGRQDQIIPIGHADEWREALPSARFEVLDPCGHAVQRERPDDLARMMADFLEERR